MIKVAWFAAIITATLIGLAVLWRFGTLLVLFLFSLAIAAALRPVTQAASSRKFSRRVGQGIVYAVLVAAILGGAALILPPLVKDIQQATNDMLTGYETARNDWPLHGSLFQRSLAGQLPPSEELYAALTGSEGIQALEQVFGAAGGFFSLLGYLLLSIVLSLYWSADRFRFERLSLSLLPAESHEKALHAWRAVETGVGAFLRSTVVESALIFLGTGLGYWALGLKYPVLLAVWVVIAGLIPWFGFPIMLLPALPIWLGISPAAGFGYIVVTASVLILVRLLVRPRFFEAPQYNSMLTLLFILGMAEGFGLIGVLLAPLLALTLRILFEDLNPVPPGRFSPDIVRKTSQIQKRLFALRSSREAAAADARLLMDRVHRLARNTRKYLGSY